MYSVKHVKLLFNLFKTITNSKPKSLKMTKNKPGACGSSQAWTARWTRPASLRFHSSPAEFPSACPRRKEGISFWNRRSTAGRCGPASTTSWPWSRLIAFPPRRTRKRIFCLKTTLVFIQWLNKLHFSVVSSLLVETFFKNFRTYNLTYILTNW